MANFTGEWITAKLKIVGIQNFQDTFEPRKRLFISAFSIYMAVPLRCVKVTKKIQMIFKSRYATLVTWKWNPLDVTKVTEDCQYR